MINSLQEDIVVDKNVCMNTSKNNVVYECLYKKEIFSPVEYTLFLDKNKDIIFFQKNKKIDFLLEYIFMDNYCIKNSVCKLENSKDMYDRLFKCAENNMYCINFVIQPQNRKNICANNSTDESLFLNSTVQKKYLSLSMDNKLDLCDFAKTSHGGHYMIGLKSYNNE